MLGKDRSTSETGHGSDEAMGRAQFRNVVGCLGRAAITDRRVDAMGHFRPLQRRLQTALAGYGPTEARLPKSARQPILSAIVRNTV